MRTTRERNAIAAALIGGAVTHYAGWRFIFWLNVAAMVPAALMLLRHPGAGGSRISWIDL